jgi:hypothetical protein
MMTIVIITILFITGGMEGDSKVVRVHTDDFTKGDYIIIYL